MAFSFVLLGGMASASTEFNSNWDGSGHISHTFTAGDDGVITLDTSGNHIEGEFNAIDHDNNPYSYEVDNINGDIDARVNDGGWVTYEHNRTDSKESMYGEAGQRSFSDVWSDNGYAGMIYKTGTNFAGMKNCEYGFQSNNQFFASGSNYEITHSISDSDDEGASVFVKGWSGNARVTDMSDESGGSGFKFGKGCGCYTNSGVEADGEGYTEISGSASNNLKGDGWEMSNGGTHREEWSYNDGVNIGESDFWMSGN